MNAAPHPAPWHSPALPPGPQVPVWAPRAQRLTLHLPGNDELIDMEPRPGGWWVSPKALEPGTDYAFRLNDDLADRPDPRSPRQPYGVHGASRTLDTSAWDHGLWTDAQWPGRDLLGAVIYELHVGTFTPAGTLDAAAQRLGHLRDLGVDIVELMPLAPVPGAAGWGYDGVSLWAVHEAYGGPEALARFVDAAHHHGIGVCLDVVYNHLGPSGNYLGVFGPYFTDAHTTPWGEAVNYDQEGSAQVRAYVIDAALRWLRDFHLDALRLDAIHEIVDDSPRHVLAELSDAVAALRVELGRPLSLVAESDLNDVGVITPTDQRPPAAAAPLGMTAQWADDVHHALHARLTGESQGYYADFAERGAWATTTEGAFLHAGTWSSFRGRSWGAPVPAGTDPRRFVVFGSNHDQVGNRALGDRPSAALDDDVLAAEAALVLLSPYTPMLFMGEEWGTRSPFRFFTDHPEADLAATVRDGRRREFADFGWDAEQIPDPQDPQTRALSVLDWSETDMAGHRRMLAWYRELIALRHRLGLGGPGVSWPRARDLGEVLVVEIGLPGPGGRLVVAVNLGRQEESVTSVLTSVTSGLTHVLEDVDGTVPPGSPPGSSQLLASWHPDRQDVLTAGQTLALRRSS
ncbi:MAG: malto-oligosyltrehalose trehalohydrolase [Actinomyces sp.]|uniref:malto-oligosyltrehalose trehalohydrolase n=1 Tax=Actinomyces sp. TaxID=29317 RepID=UPI0026DD6AE5|nr:malto-oligosyltrehalose trehalohydrolase [Actinomyces sp.]MDO4242548.1 malto-oligosyltrehalose trehalohydrolase [Actinomyces sp.]